VRCSTGSCGAHIRDTLCVSLKLCVLVLGSFRSGTKSGWDLAAHGAYTEREPVIERRVLGHPPWNRRETTAEVARCGNRIGAETRTTCPSDSNARGSRKRTDTLGLKMTNCDVMPISQSDRRSFFLPFRRADLTDVHNQSTGQRLMAQCVSRLPGFLKGRSGRCPLHRPKQPPHCLSWLWNREASSSASTGLLRRCFHQPEAQVHSQRWRSPP